MKTWLMSVKQSYQTTPVHTFLFRWITFSGFLFTGRLSPGFPAGSNCTINRPHRCKCIKWTVLLFFGIMFFFLFPTPDSGSLTHLHGCVCVCVCVSRFSPWPSLSPIFHSSKWSGNWKSSSPAFLAQQTRLLWTGTRKDAVMTCQRGIFRVKVTIHCILCVRFFFCTCCFFLGCLNLDVQNFDS